MNQQMTYRWITGLGLFVCMALTMACGEKQEQSTTSDPASAAQWAATDQGAGTDPSLVPPIAAAGAAVATQPVTGPMTVLGLTFTPDTKWGIVPTDGGMRKAQFSLSGDGGEAELVLYHFGVGGGGPVQQNLERWAGQMGATIEQSEVTTKEVNGLKISTIAVSGTYSSGMMANSSAPKPNYRMTASVIEGPGGPWFFKLVGPEATVQAQAESYNAMIDSVKTNG